MRRIYPDPAEIEGSAGLAEAYACPRDWLRVNMVASLDGAATVRGRVGALTATADQRVLVTLRMLADVVLVGAATIRAEGYGPFEVDPTWRRRRQANGQQPVPPLAIVTASGDLDLDAPVFADAEAPPLVIVPAACPRREEIAQSFPVIVAGGERVDPAEAVARLRGLGHRHVLSEGGPHMFAQLVAARLVDEVCLAIAPVLVAGEETRTAVGESLRQQLCLQQLYTADDYLFGRYRVTTAAAPGPGPGPTVWS